LLSNLLNNQQINSHHEYPTNNTNDTSEPI